MEEWLSTTHLAYRRPLDKFRVIRQKTRADVLLET